MRSSVFAATLLAAFVSPALALAAGFATQPLFLSRSPVTEGESVRIYAVLTNAATSKFTGTLTFKDGSQEIGSTAVAIDGGGTQTASVAWEPAAGTHAVVAMLDDSTGSVVEQESEQFAVQAAPSPAPITIAEPAAVESSQFIQNDIGSLSPAAESFTAPAFATVDSLRASAASAINGQLNNAKNNISGGQIEGASTSIGGAGTILWTLYMYFLTVLQFLISNAGVFYPVFALLILYILWKMFKRYRR